MASSNLKLAIVGYGKIGRAHRKVFEAQGATIIATCNRSLEAREKASAEGIPNTYEDITALLEQEALDGIICSTSIFNNFEVAKRIIPYKIPLLLEKPPGTSIEEVETLIQLEQDYQTPVMVATNRVWYSVLRKAVDDIGGLDQIKGVDVIWSENPNRLQERGFTTEQIHNRTYSNSIHGLSILQYLCGGLDNFSVSGIQHEGVFQREMSLQGLSKKGTLGRFYSSWSNILPWEVRFYGNDKYYVFKPLEQCIARNLDTREEYKIEGAEYDNTFKAGFYLQAEHFIKSIKGNPIPQEVSLDTSLELFKYAKALTNQFRLNADRSFR